MERYPRSCDEVMDKLEERHKPFKDNGWVPLEIEGDAILYRLVREADIDLNTKKPTPSSFDNFGLSVLVTSSNFPEFDVKQCVAERDIFVGAVALKASFMLELGYQICHDPHPDRHGSPQHPNHAQVVCKKTQGNKKKIRDMCEWVVCPKSLCN
jgi:hypothetical protein